MTRFFLGGHPAGLGAGYDFLPIDPSGLPATRTYSTVVEVPNGSEDQRRLVERATSLGAPAKLTEELTIWEVDAG